MDGVVWVFAIDVLEREAMLVRPYLLSFPLQIFEDDHADDVLATHNSVGVDLCCF